jgi:hypothetical protein
MVPGILDRLAGARAPTVMELLHLLQLRRQQFAAKTTFDANQSRENFVVSGILAIRNA